MTKRNGTILRLIGIIVGIALAVGSIVFGFGQKAGDIESRIAQVETKAQKIDANTKAITAIEIKLEYIIKGVDEIRAELKNDRR